MTAQTPILDRLIAHAGKARASLHVPGHHNGRVLPEKLSAWLGPAAKLDLTELPGLDNLAAPEDCILQSQRLAADWYGSGETFYSVGGSTQGILAALYGVLAEGSSVLFLNPFHQSAWQALVVRNAWPKFVQVQYAANEYAVEPPSAAMVREVLAKEADALSAVFLTSPTYEGIVADVAAIAEVVHDFGLPLIVDEAHGAHLGLISDLPPHSVACGADVVVQSVHKLLPGLTQTAWLHVQGHRVEAARILQALRLFQTTSPSYLLLASLDAAQAWLHEEGPVAAIETLQQLEKADLLPEQREHRFSGEPSTVRRDPFKLWLPTGSMQASSAIAAELAGEGIDVEYANPLGVLMLPGFNPPDWLLLRLRQLFQGAAEPARQTHLLTRREPCLVESPRAVHDAVLQRVPLKDAVGHVCGRALTPYPPGAPIVYPGEMVTAEMAESVSAWAVSGYPVHGLASGGLVDVIQR